jgi:predicted small lipoprotein YifL
MPRISRLPLLLVLIAVLAACGNKGDLVKPSTTPDAAASATTQG